MRIARECWPFAVPLAVLAIVGALVWLPAGAVLLLPLLFTLWFFRDPERSSPDEPGAVLAPADGRVIGAGPERISIFMNVFNVHVCRAPVAGTVISAIHSPGRFLAAFREDAPQANERVRIVLDGRDGPLAFTLIAGLIARRIVCKVSTTQTLVAGERVGLIRFGSRVDVELPDGAVCAVVVGNRVRAGETTLARVRTAAAGAPPPASAPAVVTTGGAS